MSHQSLDDVAETADELDDATGAALSDDATGAALSDDVTGAARRSVDDCYRVSLLEE